MKDISITDTINTVIVSFNKTYKKIVINPDIISNHINYILDDILKTYKSTTDNHTDNLSDYNTLHIWDYLNQLDKYTYIIVLSVFKRLKPDLINYGLKAGKGSNHSNFSWKNYVETILSLYFKYKL